MKRFLYTVLITSLCLACDAKKSEKLNYKTHFLASANTTQDIQVEIIKQQIWENLRKVPGTERDYITEVHLRIANGNIIDTDCTILFPKSSWDIASVIVDDYKDVLKKTSIKIFDVFYKLITDPNILANELNMTGLWRPWGGSHVHPDGRGMDFGYIRSSLGSGVDYKFSTSATENAFGKSVRTVLTTNFPPVNEFLSPWFMCSPSSNCNVNAGVTKNEKTHRDHMHLTLNP